MDNFPKLAMAKFSDQHKGQNLISMHNTNPEPFTQTELEETIGQSFNSILQDVNLGFTADAGTHTLRQTLADEHYDGIIADEVITHAGAQEALYCAFSALLHTGDRVLTVAPVFEPLLQIPINIGCELCCVYLDADNNWSLNLDDVEAEFKRGCQMFIINFPHNPTGTTITETKIMHVIKLCQKYDVWLLSDEVFRGLEHEAKYRLPAVADLYDKGISVGVISKAFAIPGIRVGWLVCKNKQLRDKVLQVKDYLSICNSQVDELLASVLLKHPEKLLERNMEIILKNKKLLKNIKSIANHKIEIFIPNTGCCVFTRIIGNEQSEILVNKIAKQYKYLLYPAVLFKTNDNAMRIGFGNRNFMDFYKKIK